MAKISFFDKKFFFVTKDKTQAIILSMSYIRYLQVFDSKNNLEFPTLDCHIYIILKIIKDKFCDTKEVQYYI